jgi:hypothetical protein
MGPMAHTSRCSRAAAAGTVAALMAACSLVPTVPASVTVSDPVGDVAGDIAWMDIRRLTLLQTDQEMKISLDLARAPDPTRFMTYGIDFDTDGDGEADYSLWAEYFGTGTAAPGYVVWGEGESLFDEAFPGKMIVEGTTITWTISQARIPGESRRVAACADLSGEPETAEAVLVARDCVPDGERTPEDSAWVVVP